MKLSAPLTATQLHHWFHAPFSELNPLFQHARRITDEYFDRQISIFIPGKRFPPISITGESCYLHCQHCGGRFLSHMHAITQPEDLLTFCQQLVTQQGVGCLISGGCDARGQVPLTPFLLTLTEIKRTTNLFLNVHTGFLTTDEAQHLTNTGIDCVSVDVVGDNSTIHQIYGLFNRSTSDYAATLQALAAQNVSVAPHVCVGLHYGQLVGELTALQLIHASLKPSVLVIIALMPTPNTAMAITAPPLNYDIARVCALARLLFPETEIALGCMRPRGAARREMEVLAIKAGITRLVLPTRAALNYLKKNNYETPVKEACCVV